MEIPLRAEKESVREIERERSDSCRCCVVDIVSTVSSSLRHKRFSIQFARVFHLNRINAHAFTTCPSVRNGCSRSCVRLNRASRYFFAKFCLHFSINTNLLALGRALMRHYWIGGCGRMWGVEVKWKSTQNEFYQWSLGELVAFMTGEKRQLTVKSDEFSMKIDLCRI